MKKNGITYYKTDPVYSNNKFLTSALGKEGFFTTDEKKTIGLTGKEVDNNFLVLEGRDIYKFYFDENNNLTIETLNGDKYLVEFNNILQQPDWNCKDIKSISYIKNKPENISDFNNDLGYTKTIFSSSLNQETYKKEELYEIGYITTNNKPKRVYGKVFLWPEIKTVDVEFNETIQNYVFNITESMFKENKITYFLLNSFLEKGGKGVDCIMTLNHNVEVSNIRSNIDYSYSIRQMNVILKDYEENDICITISTDNPKIIMCFSDLNNKKHVVLNELKCYTPEITEKTNLLLNNDIGDENIAVYVTGLGDNIIKDVYSFNQETVKVLFNAKEKANIKCITIKDLKESLCYWDVTDTDGKTTTYENVSAIELSMEKNCSVRCYLNK